MICSTTFLLYDSLKLDSSVSEFSMNVEKKILQTGPTPGITDLQS